MARFRGVHPKRSHATFFEREARRAYLRPFLESVVQRLRQVRPDIPFETLSAIVEDAVVVWGSNQQASDALLAAAEAWGRRVNRYHETEFVKDFLRVTRVDVRPLLRDAPTREVMEAGIRDSVGLIKTIPARMHESLFQQYITRESESPLDLRERERMLKKGFGSTGFKLRRIVRDQSSKMTGQLSRVRQHAAGVEQFYWRTAGDGRVRESHRRQDGELFSWGVRPAVTGFPGEDVNCRCVSIPKITIAQIRSRAGRT